MFTEHQVLRVCMASVMSLTIFTVGCATRQHARVQGEVRTEIPPVGYSSKERELVGADASDWGLSFSGGGIRAAYFAIGVSKALFQTGLLKDVDAISSVSGGSYASAWLQASRLQGDRKQAFGSELLAAESYPATLCELMVAGNFVTYGTMLKAAALPGISFVGMYEESLIRTFGGRPDSNGAQPLRGLMLHQLAPLVKSHATPYPIFNATVLDPASATWRESLFEFTPVFAGNDRFGHVQFSEAHSFPVVKAIAISGAAVKPALKQEISFGSSAQAGERLLVISDGGHSENLGAIALIRRGVKNIIVVDAEHDPQYGFGAYRKLREELAAFGLTLMSETLDPYLDGGTLRNSEAGPIRKSFETAKVRRRSPGGRLTDVSTIYYLKMSLPVSVQTILADEGAYRRGKITDERFRDELKQGAAPNGDWQCASTRHLAMDVRDWAIYSVASYSGAKKSRPLLSNAKGFLHYSFPQMSTADQSLYNDQALAVIALGYLEGAELSEALLKVRK